MFKLSRFGRNAADVLKYQDMQDRLDNLYDKASDKLDVSDKHYDRKYQDMQDRLDNLYDKASELEDTMADIDSQIGGAYEKQITAKQLYKILANFDKLYYRLTDLEKKEFLRDFIESVEIYPENEVELEMSEMDLTAAESKATYEEIKDYVLEHTGFKN